MDVDVEYVEVCQRQASIYLLSSRNLSHSFVIWSVTLYQFLHCYGLFLFIVLCFNFSKIPKGQKNEYICSSCHLQSEVKHFLLCEVTQGVL